MFAQRRSRTHRDSDELRANTYMAGYLGYKSGFSTDTKQKAFDITCSCVLRGQNAYLIALH